MHHTIFSLLLLGCIFCSPLPLIAQDDNESEEPEDVLPEGVIKESYPSKVAGAADLNLYLKFPAGGKEAVKGVMAICKYGDRQIAMDLTGGSRHFSHLLEFASDHQLATVAFGQPSRGKGWNRTVNSDLLSNRQANAQDRKLDDLAREWSRIIQRFSRKHGLPDKDWLLYGICGGAQFAHRVALRQPQHFKAVHVHYGGSYDVPTPQGKSILWMVTSHADEPAYIAAQRFYRLCREQDYRMILKGFTRRSAPEEYDPDYRYTGRSKLQQLSWIFFEYAMKGENSADTGGTEAFIADYVNGVVVPAEEGSWIPKTQAVHLPTKELAQAWGTVQE